jgi:hypothetical protein
MERELKFGQEVIFIDPYKREHRALITDVHGNTCCNLVFVSDDEKKTDDWGRQLERESSCVHISQNEARAHCWKHIDE